jgi:NAD(P)-dependent dehydrogenase (short-subunit alcohol dehydrogenase family)
MLMSARLAGRTAVIVGAGQTPGATIGNGRAMAVTFAREGARLVLVDRKPEQLADTVDLVRAEGAEVVPVIVDIATADGPAAVVQAAVSAFGGFDILVNNVGIGAGDSVPHQLTDDAYDRIMDVNLRALWRTCREAIPTLRAAGRAAVVNISSVAAVAYSPALTAYGLSKAGVNAITVSLALNNAKHGVRANAIMPGLVDTPMGVDAVAAARGMDRADYAAARAAQVPMGRQGTAWDVANAALFLASDEAGWITGVVLPVDGGQSARIG